MQRQAVAHEGPHPPAGFGMRLAQSAGAASWPASLSVTDGSTAGPSPLYWQQTNGVGHISQPVMPAAGAGCTAAQQTAEGAARQGRCPVTLLARPLFSHYQILQLPATAYPDLPPALCEGRRVGWGSARSSGPQGHTLVAAPAAVAHPSLPCACRGEQKGREAGRQGGREAGRQGGREPGSQISREVS